MIDGIIDAENKKSDPSPKLIQEEIQRERFKEKLSALAKARANKNNEEVVNLLNEIFLFERSKPRLAVLEDHSRPDVLAKKRELISELRQSGVYVLEKGAIEAYYPASVTGSDKPSKAQSFCAQISSREEILSLCDTLEIQGAQVAELDVVMGAIFSNYR